MKVFKFGGASVKNAEAIKNVANILKNYQEESLIIVISAMGKRPMRWKKSWNHL
jgi:aspartate kinase